MMKEFIIDCFWWVIVWAVIFTAVFALVAV